jgi:hypothetical protein
MAFSAIITLSSAGADTSFFNLYSNVDGYVTAFETAISKASLLAGYTSNVVPDLTSVVRIKATGLCTNYRDIGVDDPTVAVYERCLDGFIAYIDAAITSSAFSEDNTPQCYQKIDQGALTAMNAAYPGMTNVASLVFSSCSCV